MLCEFHFNLKKRPLADGQPVDLGERSPWCPEGAGSVLALTRAASPWHKHNQARG